MTFDLIIEQFKEIKQKQIKREMKRITTKKYKVFESLKLNLEA